MRTGCTCMAKMLTGDLCSWASGDDVLSVGEAVGKLCSPLPAWNADRAEPF